MNCKQRKFNKKSVQKKSNAKLNLKKSTVNLPADAENYRVQQIADGKRTQTIEAAKALAERIKKIGLAEATAIEMIGKADAERMHMCVGIATKGNFEEFFIFIARKSIKRDLMEW